MSLTRIQKGKRRRSRSDVPTEVVTPQNSRFPIWLFLFALGAIIVGSGLYLAMADSKKETSSEPASVTPINNALQASLPSLGDLALMSSDELAKQDIALLNLRCAEGLPDSENLNIEQCLATLGKWAAFVEHETKRHLYKFRKNPTEFENSESFYRMMMLITVLQQDYKVHYNPERIRKVDFTKSKDLFLHGMVGSNGAESNGGTCASMPVLYTAIARRLGYPVFLVTAKEHIFCRWDSPNERFNIEATNQGMNSFDDDYYMKWPKQITEAEVKAGHFLKSLDASESLAMFLAARGHCLEDNRFSAKARVAYAMAAEKGPQNPIYFGFLAQTMKPLTRLADFHARRQVEPPMVYNQDPWNRIPGANMPQQRHSVLKPPFTANPAGFSTQRPTGFGFQP